jgi:hypothetical protein
VSDLHGSYPLDLLSLRNIDKRARGYADRYLCGFGASVTTRVARRWRAQKTNAVPAKHRTEVGKVLIQPERRNVSLELRYYAFG